MRPHPQAPGATEPEAVTDAPEGRLSGTITALEVQARDQTRVNLYLDGRFAFGLHAKIAAEAGLKKGDFLSAGQVTELLKGEAFERALLQSFNYLSFRGRSISEMERYLRDKGHAPETIAGVVKRLVDLHYLDDAHFALSWVENRQRYRPRGPHLLRTELRQKGIGRDTADQVVADASANQETLALESARKRAASLRTDDYGEFRRKLGGFLSRRGYSSEVVWDVVKRLWAQRSAEPFDEAPGDDG